METIISEVLTAVLRESRAWKLCTFQVREHFPKFLLVIKICLVIPIQTPCRERGNSCLNRIICDFWSTLGVSTVEALMRIILLMVLFLRSTITDWQDENKRTKRLGSQIWENLCSLYSNKCLCLVSEKFVLASGSHLSLATGLTSWKVSLELGLYQSKLPESLLNSDFWQLIISSSIWSWVVKT